MERGLGIRWEIWISEIELQWICLILEDASLGYDKDFAWSYEGFVRRVKVSRSVLIGGFTLRLDVNDNRRVWYVMMPELCGNGGWVDISRKFWEFYGWRRPGGRVDGRSFVEVEKIGGWPANTVVVVENREKRRDCDVEVEVDSTQNNERFLGRCLVGWMENGALALPMGMELQRWALRSWKVTAGVQVSELGGSSSLFTLPLMEAAKRVLAEYWSFGGRRLDLEWWSLVGCCVKQGEARAEVWVKILGLPIHLWDLEVFREVGDFCGGFLHVDDETSQITHLKWARIAVQASFVG